MENSVDYLHNPHENNPDNQNLVQPDYEVANLEKAIQHRNERSIRKVIKEGYTNYSIWSTSLEEIGKFSLGLELYFWLIKTMLLAFFLISAISICSLYQNSQGSGLLAGDTKQKWDILSIANTNLLQSTSDLTQNKSTLNTLFIVDAICSITLLVFIILYQLKCSLIIKKHSSNSKSISEFAVKVKGFPENIIDTSIIKNHFSKFGEVHEVALAKRYHGILSAYVTRANLQYQYTYNKILVTAGKKKEKLLEKIERKIKLIDIKIKERETSSDKTHNELPTVRAFVTFDSIESANKCLKAYNKKFAFFWTLSNKLPDLYLSNTYFIKVKKTEVPSCINFLNLEISKSSKRVRRIISLILILLVFIITMSLILALSTYQNNLPRGPACNGVDASQDIKFAKEIYFTDDQTYCWCKGQSYDSILNEEEFNYCAYYFQKISINVGLRVLVSFSILFLNYTIKSIVLILSKLERSSNINKERLKVMTRTFYATFINTAIIILVVNADFSIIGTNYWLPSFLFNGVYTDFTREWYTEVGSTLTTTMLVQIFSPHWINMLVLYPIGAFKRKLGIKKCITKEEANTRFTGAPFDLAIKNSYILKVIFCCFLYSSGIPVLNVFCFACLFGLYWIEKFLILRHYEKPIQYNHVLNEEVIRLLPFSVVGHCAFGLYMFGSDSIFPLNYGKSNSLGERIQNYTGLIYILIMIIVGCSFLWIYTYGSCNKFLRKRSINDEKVFMLSDEGKKAIEDGEDSFDVCKRKEFKEPIYELNTAAEKIKFRKTSEWIQNNLN